MTTDAASPAASPTTTPPSFDDVTLPPVETSLLGSGTPPNPAPGALGWTPSLDASSSRPAWTPNFWQSQDGSSTSFYPDSMRAFIDKLGQSNDPSERAMAARGTANQLPVADLISAAQNEVGMVQRFEANPDPTTLDPENPGDVQFFQWQQNRGLLPKAPGFADSMTGLAEGLWQGTGDVLGNLGAAMLDPTTVSDSPGDAITRLTDEGTLAEQEVKANYQYLASGAWSLLKKAAVKMGSTEILGDPTIQAQVKDAVGQADLIHYQRVAQISAQTESVRNDALSSALKAGADPDSFDGAALTLSLLGDPANYVLPAAAGAVGDALSVADKPMLGITEGLRLKVANMSATQATLTKQIAEMTAAGGDYAAERLPDLQDAHGAVTGELQGAQTAMNASNAADAAWLAKFGPSTTQKVVGGALKGAGAAAETVGSGLSNLNDSVVDSLSQGVKGAPAKATSFAGKILKNAAPTALAGGALGYAINGTDGAEEGAAAGAALPMALSYAGRLTRIVGETYSLGQSTIPFLQRLATNTEATGMESWLARKIDPFEGFQPGAGSWANAYALTKRAAYGAGATATDFATGAAKGAVPGAALGYVASGGDDDGASQGAGAAVASHFAPWGIIGGFYNAFRPAFSPDDLVAQRAGNLALLKQRWENDPTSLSRLNSLTTGQALDISSFAAANPDFSLLLTNRDQDRVAVENAGKDVPDLNTVPGFHYMDPETGRSTIVLNPLDPNPKNSIGAVFSHEFVHSAMTSGLADPMTRAVVGDPDLGVPGIVSQIGPDGDPIRNPDGSFAVTPDFSAAKNQYVDRVRGLGNPNFGITDKDFSLEYAAEAGTDILLGNQDGMFRPTVGSMVNEALGGPLFLRNVLAKFGTPFTPTGDVVGTMGLPGLEHSPQVTNLISDYVKQWAGRGQETDEPLPVNVSREAILNNPSLLKTVFGGSSELNWDSRSGLPKGVEIVNGKPVVTDEKAMFKTAKMIADDQATMSDAVIAAAKAADDVATDPNAVRSTVVDGQTVWSGKYLSDKTLSGLAGNEKLNPIQVQNLQNINALLKAGTGDYVKMLYQPATTIGKQYRALSGEWRSEVPISIRVTNHGNVTFNTVSFDKVVTNLQKLWGTDPERATGLWASQQSMIADAHTYIDNLSAGRPGAEGLSDAKKNFLNLSLGISTKGREQANPLWDQSSKQIRSWVTTRRIDRVNRLTSGERSDQIPWSSAAWSRAKLNLTAGNQ